MTSCAAGPWQIYMYSFGEGQRVSVRFRLPSATEARHVGYDACRRVVMYSAGGCYDNGLPGPEEFARLNADEERLVAALDATRVDCLLVGAMSYHCLRDVVFQVNDVAGFAGVYEQWRAGRASNEVELVEKEGWEFFDTKIRPKPIHW